MEVPGATPFEVKCMGSQIIQELLAHVLYLTTGCGFLKPTRETQLGQMGGEVMARLWLS